MKATVIFNNCVTIFGVRRIEQDHKSWYVWSGDPRNGSDRLHPDIFHKADGKLEIIVKEK